ncbi:MAG: 30S ribosomal protein S6 [Firmicutes bacterium]|nr:30S ribosomal protein S6 [Bacillota bacterium]
MAAYEAMYILKPDLGEEELAQAIERVQGLIGQAGGTVDQIDKWGKRRLAYPINGYNDGYYVVTTFNGDGNVANELTRLMGIQEVILRSMVVRAGE